MAIPLALLDTDTLSEIMKARDAQVLQNARDYLSEHGHFRFSILSRYEILRGLKASNAAKQIELFENRCLSSYVISLTDDVVVRAADIYATLRREGNLITDADILIAATALIHQLILVTENTAHFNRISGLTIKSWRAR